MQEQDQPRIVVQRKAGIVRVGFVERNVIDELSIAAIKESLLELVDSTPGIKLLLSFEGVEHLSSAALGVLLTVNKHVQQQGGVLKLSDIDSRLMEVFKITKLDRVFEIYQTAQAAEESFNK